MTKHEKLSKKSSNIDAPFHVTGRTKYVDDMPELQGTLFVKIFPSPVAHGQIIRLDYSKALQMPGVVAVLSEKDIPGENELGGIVKDEPMLAEQEVHFEGQPILLVIAETEDIAHHALSLIEIDIEAHPVTTDPIIAHQQGDLLHKSRTFSIGNTQEAFAKCKHVFEGTAESGGQEHVYLEPQGAYSIPQDKGGITIYSSTQGPTAVQRTVARILDMPMSQIEVDVNRIGGGFGGKEDQASPWAAMAALATYHLRKPVKLILERKEDLKMTGKRHPYKSRYKIGLDEDLNILAYEATFFQNGGAAADLSPPVLGRTLFHSTNSYDIPNVDATAHCCKTNIVPNTAFRGFGGPQGMFVIESAIHYAARQIGVTPIEIQAKNLLKENAVFPYGQIVKGCEARQCWSEAVEKYQVAALQKEVDDFNQQHAYQKKGFALMPVCFGISFTNTPMNNARALVHIYSDGSVGVNTGAVEMGQGVNTKMVQIAAQMFGLPQQRIQLNNTNTTRVANTSPSAASATADLNGKALQDAGRQLTERLHDFIRQDLNLNKNERISFKNEQVYVNEKASALSWEELIQKALAQRINLSAKGHYATPVIHFDRNKEKGHPFAYHVYGTAILTCTVDCIRGIYEFDKVQIVHDFGASMNREIDLGQIEGGLVQGMGWMTLEEIIYNEKGLLKSNSLATYKIPDIYAAPKTIDVHFLNTDTDNEAILKSKAVGEPPLMYGIGAYFAICNAVLAFNPKAKIDYVAPMTTERVLMGLYGL